MRRKCPGVGSAARHAIEAMEGRILLSSAAYTWQNVNIGAGGFVDGIFYDPHNQNVIYARTDIGGLYKSTNDGTSWSQLLDFVGNNTTGSGNGTQSQLIGVLSFAIDPENSNNIYADVGEYSGTNGAVFYSTNGGQSWGQTNLSFYVGGNSTGRGDGEQIAVDPNDSNIVFLGSNNNGLWESTNAGHSFTQISTSAFSPSSTTFVLFDPSSATAGNPSQKIYVGINSTSGGTNLYFTSNGGTSWAQLGGTGTLPGGYLPGHAVLSGGNLYLGYANAEAPDGNITNGGVYRLTVASGVWASISPLATNGNFGYDGVAADPENVNTVVVTSFDDYSGPDRMWRSVNANAATPSWTEVYDYATAQNSGYGGYDTTRNTTNAPWTASFGDGISNWAAAIAINPFNSNQLMYGTGQGIWATNNLSNGGANTQLTAANSWYFPDTGIEFTAVGGVAAPTGGVALYSAMGDIGGFANSTLSYSPQQGNVGGSGSATDYAGTKPADGVIVGSMGSNNGSYTTNGTTFSGFAANPGGSGKDSGGSVAESANGSTIVWSPSSHSAYYSTNNGSSWTAAAFSSLSSLTLVGSTATAVTSAANSLIAGELVEITGGGFDGTFTVASIVNSTTFTFSDTQFSVSSLGQSGGVATAVTSGNNGFVVGDTVTIAGATPTAYDGTFTITNINSSNSFNYSVPSGTSNTVSGTITAIVNAASGAATAVAPVGTVVADKVNPNYFYYWVENNNDNSWRLFVSSNGGQSFAFSSGATVGTGNVTLVANPYVAGQLWLSSYIGMYESTNFGTSFTHMGSSNANVSSNDMALGAAAPGAVVPAIYMYGTIASGGFEGVYRSDDGGSTWLLLNDASHQWGGLIQTVAADPNVFGRVYLGINGRGIIMGNPATSLPSGWVDQDVNEPGNPGWATSSTTLSNGTTSSQWNIAGGGANLAATGVAISSLSRSGGVATAISTAANGFQVGQMVTIAGANQSVYDGMFVITGLANTTAGIGSQIGSATEFTFAIASGTDSASGTITATVGDQFSYADEPVTGNATISAELQSLTNADNGNGTPAAGVMYRAGISPSDPFFEVIQTTGNGIVLKYRTAAGGSVTTTSASGSFPVGSYYVEIVRSGGSNFSAYYILNGTPTQVDSTVAIAAMPSTANVGLVASAGYNPQLTDAGFANVVVTPSPTVTTAAGANPSPVTGKTTNLSVVGAENGSAAGLTYTWAATGPASVSYTDNGSATALNTTAIFSAAGSYMFTVTISDAGSRSVTSSVSVVVDQTLSSASIAPTSAVVAGGQTAAFTAMGYDQFTAVMNPQPTFAWSTTGGGTVNGGSFTASQVGGNYTVTATAGSFSPGAAITVVPTIYSSGGIYYVAMFSGSEEIWVGSAGVGGPTYSIVSGSLPSLTFNDGSLTVDFSGGDSVPAGGLVFDGTALSIIGTTGNDTITVNPTNVAFNSDVPITYSNLQSVQIIGGSGADVITQAETMAAVTIVPTSADTLNANDGTFSIPAPAMGSGFDPYFLSAVNIADGATMSMQSSGSSADRTVLVLGNGLVIAPTGKLDVGGNDAIVEGGDIGTLSGYAGEGLMGNAGIISSAAAGTANQTVAVVLNVDNEGNPMMTGFDGQTVHKTDVLIKYTFFGDADLSGSVTAADYQLIDDGFNSLSGPNPLSGWQNGDFNYDGKINGDDYSLIDNAFNTQNRTQLLAVAAPTAMVAPVHVATALPLSTGDSDDNLLKRRQHRESLVQSIAQLED